MDDHKPSPSDSLTGNEDFGSSDVMAGSFEGETEGDLPEFNPEMMAQLDELQKKLQRSEELEREVADWKTKYARLYADFDNYRRRTSEEAQEAKIRGEANAVEAMLGTFDDVSRALDAGVKDPSTLLPGFESVRNNFLKALGQLECQPVPGKGEAFDPHVHEAIGTAPGETDDQILEVYQTGFVLRGKLVRPARVLVSKTIN